MMGAGFGCSEGRRASRRRIPQIARYPETTPRLTAERIVSSTVVETNIVLNSAYLLQMSLALLALVPE
jgi:hypothetical protein